MIAMRQNSILEFLRVHGNASFGQIADALGVSQETARRDIKTLNEQGVVRSIRGGAALPEVLEQAAFHYCLLEAASAKQQIAERAAQEVENGDSLLIGGGSTTFYFASALRRHRELTVVTNSVDVARVMSHGGNVVHTIGGELRPLSGSVLGPRAVQSLQDFAVDKAFFSVASLTARAGYGHEDADESAFTRALLGRARVRYALVDNTKMQKDAVFVIAPLGAVDVLITDGPPPSGIAEAVAAAGSRLIIAN